CCKRVGQAQDKLAAPDTVAVAERDGFEPTIGFQQPEHCQVTAWVGSKNVSIAALPQMEADVNLGRAADGVVAGEDQPVFVKHDTTAVGLGHILRIGQVQTLDDLLPLFRRQSKPLQGALDHIWLILPQLAGLPRRNVLPKALVIAGARYENAG